MNVCSRIYITESGIFANDRIFVFMNTKRAQANYRALRVLGLKHYVSYKIQDLDASESGAYDGQERITDWRNTPYLNRWNDDHQLKLNANDSDNANDNWSSPTVRDCS